MIYLYYKDAEVTACTYILEFTNKEGKEDMYVSRGTYSYARLLIFALDNNITGLCIYPLTRSKIKIINGLPINRGRKKMKKEAAKLSFVQEIPTAPAMMQYDF